MQPARANASGAVRLLDAPLPCPSAGGGVCFLGLSPSLYLALDSLHCNLNILTININNLTKRNLYLCRFGDGRRVPQ
jgi:hypothetical protein